MADPTRPESGSVPPSPAGEGPEAGRRRLLQGGLGAAPVLMTLVSRPVLAQRTGLLCTTPSGFVSANASTAGRGVSCTGRTYTGWISISGNPSNWPPGYPPSRTFDSVFNNPVCGGFSGPPPKTLLQVLQLPVPPTDPVARVVVAALLNAAANLTPVLSVATVKHMWEEYCTTGSFSPSSGASWNQLELLDYLRTTQQTPG